MGSMVIWDLCTKILPQFQTWKKNLKDNFEEECPCLLMAGERIGETVEGIGAALANHTDWFDSEKNDCKSWKSSYEKGFYNYAMDSEQARRCS